MCAAIVHIVYVVGEVRAPDLAWTHAQGDCGGGGRGHLQPRQPGPGHGAREGVPGAEDAHLQCQRAGQARVCDARGGLHDGCVLVAVAGGLMNGVAGHGASLCGACTGAIAPAARYAFMSWSSLARRC